MTYRIIGSDLTGRFGGRVLSEDMDGDGIPDLIVTADASSHGWTYVILGSRLANLDAADGATDGLIDMDHFGPDDGYVLIGRNRVVNQTPHQVMASLGDVAGDGLPELLIGDWLDQSGAAYVVSWSDFATLDAADGTSDGVITLSNSGTAAGYRFATSTPNILDQVGYSVATGQFGGDARQDFLVSAPRDTTPEGRGSVYLVRAEDFGSLDIADGTADRRIDLDRIGTGHGGHVFTDASFSNNSGYAEVGGMGDLDGDGIDEIVIGNRDLVITEDMVTPEEWDEYWADVSRGGVFLLPSLSLDALDRANDPMAATDGRVSLTDVFDGTGGYFFYEESGGGELGSTLGSPGDVDGDGRPDLLIGSSAFYLVRAADLDRLAPGGSGRIRLDSDESYTGVYRFTLSFAHFESVGDLTGAAGDDILVASDRRGSLPTGSFLFGASDAELAALDAADGETDLTIDTFVLRSSAFPLSGGYSLLDRLNPEGVAISGSDLALLPDMDGDGAVELLIGAPLTHAIDPVDGSRYYPGEVFLFSTGDLAALDARDGVTDGRIDMGNVPFLPTAGDYRFFGPAGDATGVTVARVGDLDGDGTADFLVGSALDSAGPPPRGVVFFVGSTELEALDLVDLTEDEIIHLANVGAPNGGLRILEAPGQLLDVTGLTPTLSLDADADAVPDLLIGGANRSFLLFGDRLDDLDTNDHRPADGSIDLPLLRPADGYLFVHPGSTGAAASPVDTDTDGIADAVRIGAATDGSGGTLIALSDLAARDLDDGSADGVIHLTPRVTSYRFLGGADGDGAGISVASAGDVDGDGRADLLIGAFLADFGPGLGPGTVYLVPAADLAALDAADGRVNGVIDLDRVGTAGGYVLTGAAAGDFTGYSVHAAGDIDGDGRGDLVIGAAAASDGGPGSGKTYILRAADLASLDAANGTDGRIDLGDVGAAHGGFVVIGQDSNNDGISVASAGDFDGDGVDDLLIGAPGYDQDAIGERGAVWLLPSAKLSDLDAADGMTDGRIHVTSIGQHGSYGLIGAEADGEVGVSVSSAGDVDGDGRADLLLGGHLVDGNGVDSGAVVLLLAGQLADADTDDGTTDGRIDLGTLGAGRGYVFAGAAAGDLAGLTVAGAGDVDGDGLADLLIGAPLASDGGDRPGTVYLVFGKDLGALDAADHVTDGRIDLGAVGDGLGYSFVGEAHFDALGYVAGLGDADRDGHADILLAAYRSDADPADPNTNEGKAYLVTWADLAALDTADGGPADGVIRVADVGPGGGYAIIGRQPWDLTGGALGAGDVDGDLRSDLILGASQINDNGTRGPGEATMLLSAELAALDAEDGTVDGVIHLDSVLCFVRGTRIATIRGPVPVEDLRPGDRVLTMDEGYRPLVWVGRTARLAYGRMAPVRIAAGALGNLRELRVSPQHRMLVGGAAAGADGAAGAAFVPAIRLANGDTIRQVEGGTVEYFHVMCDRHQVLFAEGAPAESFFPGPQAWKTLLPEARAELRDLFPGLAPEAAERRPGRPGPGPVPGYGPLARPVVRGVAARTPRPRNRALTALV